MQGGHPGTCGKEFVITKLSVVAILWILCSVDSKWRPNMLNSRPTIPTKIPSECSDLHLRQSENISALETACVCLPHRCVCAAYPGLSVCIYRLLYLWPVMRVQWVRSAFLRWGNNSRRMYCADVSCITAITSTSKASYYFLDQQ